MTLLDERETVGFVSARVNATMARRIGHLEDFDRVLTEMYLAGRVSLRQAAKLMGRSPGAISRRLRRILARLNHPVTQALIERGRDVLNPLQREIGLDYFLRGRNARQIARDHQITRHRVRRTVSFIEGWGRGVGGYCR